MAQYLRNLFAAPVLADEEQTRSARLLSGYINMILVCMPVVAVSLPFAAVPRAGSWLVLALAALVLLGMRVVLRAGRVRLLSWMVVLVGVGAVTGTLLVRGTILTAGTSGYLLIVVMAGLLLGMRGTVVSLVVSTAALGATYWAESSGAFPPADVGKRDSGGCGHDGHTDGGCGVQCRMGPSYRNGLAAAGTHGRR